MFEDFSAGALNPLAIWNPARDVWETESIDLLSEHSDAYSETWPVSGMTQGGVAFELPMPEHPTNGFGSSLLRTPCAAEAEGGPLHPDVAKARGQTLRLTGQILAHTGDLKAPMLPTPTTSDKNGIGVHGQGAMDLRTTVALLKTPTAQLAVNGGAQPPSKRKAGGHGPTLADEIEHLLPTPQVADATGGHTNRSGSRSNELLLPGLAEKLGASSGPRSTGGNEPSQVMPPPLYDLTDVTAATA